jgi:hypothetical protein
MKDVNFVLARQIRIFQADAIPLTALVTKKAREALLSPFAFESFSVDQETSEFVFGGGGYELDPPKGRITLASFRVSPRRIVLDVVGVDSSAATEVFDALIARLSSVKQPPAALKAVVVTNESICVATLDFDWSAMISPAYREYVNTSLLDKAGQPEVEARVDRVGINITLAYRTTAPQYSDVSFGQKTFFIEPRADVPLTERRFYCASPTDTDTHLELLRELEDRLRTDR